MDLNILNLDSLEQANFNVDEFVKMVAAKDIYASKIAETKEKLNRLSTQTAEEIKQNVYKNYTNFMETSKEVGHLESKMNQLRQSLDDQRKLLTLFKNLSVNSNTKVDPSPSNKSLSGQNSSLSLLLEQVEGCGVIAQKPGRSLLFHSDLEVLHTDDYSLSQKVHAYLLSDALLLTLPQRKRNRSNFSTSVINRHRSNSLIGHTETTNNYQYKFHAFYELDLINILNIEDSKEVRNSFQVSKFPESLIFRCSNAHLKKEWLESIENARKQLLFEMSSKGLNKIAEEEEDDMEKSTVSVQYEKNKQLRDLFSEFDILLAQRDFEKAVDMLLKIKARKTSTDSSHHLVYKQKEAELISILRKDLVQSKERRNSKGVVKTGKRVVNSLIKLEIIDEAIDLFIDYHKHLNSETLRKIKLEESNSIYMNNVLDSFFANLKQSYVSFKEQFANLVNDCYSTYLSWCDTEIEILIKKLQSQHYLGRQFVITIENVQLIYLKADDFLNTGNFDVKFMFEVKLNPIVEKCIREQYEILIDASLQRSKLELENTSGNNEQNKQQQIDKFITDFQLLQFGSNKHLKKFDFNLLKQCTSSAIQFTRGALVFFVNCLRIYYQDINYSIVESFTKLFKAEVKIYTSYMKKLNSIKISKEDICNNICLVENVFKIIQEIYVQKSGLNSKHFSDVSDKIVKFKSEYF